MKREEKEIFVSQITEELKEKKNFFFACFQGVKTEEINELRNRLRLFSWEYRVIKNNLYQRIFENLGLEDIDTNWRDKFFQGPTGLLLEKSHPEDKKVIDSVEVSKILAVFVKNHPNFRINAGFVGGRIFSAEQINNLAKLPSAEILRKQLVNQLYSPLFRLINVLRVPLIGLVYLLEQRSKKVS